MEQIPKTETNPRNNKEDTLQHLACDDCRKILQVAGEYSSVNEIMSELDIPRSTLYRKLEKLNEAGLVEEGVKLRADGRHTQIYKRKYESIEFSLKSGEIEIEPDEKI
ncbi:MAG: helix-turn-helix domain-containing protein [Halobacteria archaeon]